MTDILSLIDNALDDYATSQDAMHCAYSRRLRARRKRGAR